MLIVKEFRIYYDANDANGGKKIPKSKTTIIGKVSPEMETLYNQAVQHPTDSGAVLFFGKVWAKNQMNRHQNTPLMSLVGLGELRSNWNIKKPR